MRFAGTSLQTTRSLEFTRCPRLVLVASILALSATASSSHAQTQCDPLMSCPDCFAVFVVPDTQGLVDGRYNNPYTTTGLQPLHVGDQAAFEEERAIQLEKTMEWVCQHRDSWTEPTTEKCMPISLVIHLGDIVERGGGAEECPENACEWRRASTAFSALDQCQNGGPVPYLTVSGNHDYDDNQPGLQSRLRPSTLYSQYFGQENEARVSLSAPYRCAALDDCDDEAGKWFLGGGATPPCAAAEDDCPATPPSTFEGGEWIRKNSRTATGQCTSPGTQTCGPALNEAGRSRAGLIRTRPSGLPFLFLGLEDTFSLNTDALLWPARVLQANPGVPTVLFNHEGLLGQSALETLVSESHQVFLLVHGHWWQDDDAFRTVELANGHPFGFWELQRDYQNHPSGRQVILAFDPGAAQVRAASYLFPLGGDLSLVDPPTNKALANPSGATVSLDPDLGSANCTPPTETEPADCPDNNGGQLGHDKRFYPPTSYTMPSCVGGDDPDGDGWHGDCDNCPLTANADQIDRDADGVGDVCDSCPLTPNADDQDDSDGDGVGDLCDNCRLVANGPTLGTGSCVAQEDGDSDGFGNACDTDVDNDGATGGTDVLIVLAAAQALSTDPTLDFNCDGAVGGDDVVRVLADSQNVVQPGPSGLPCATAGPATPPCTMADSDMDGVPDFADNCKSVANGPAAATGVCHAQEDANQDGYGNACDTDVGDDGATGSDDFIATQNNEGSYGYLTLWDYDCDLDVDAADTARALDDTEGTPATPGPSGLACASSNPPPAQPCTAPAPYSYEP